MAPKVITSADKADGPDNKQIFVILFHENEDETCAVL
jgi:hypothetical protein